MDVKIQNTGKIEEMVKKYKIEGDSVTEVGVDP